MTATLTRRCDACKGVRHRAHDHLRYSGRHAAWLCAHCEWMIAMASFVTQLTVYATCRRCKTVMRVTDPRDTVHPTCEPKPTRLETLSAGWLSAITHGQDEDAALTEKEIDALTARPPRLARAAVSYAKWGWPVFPLAHHSKAPAIPKRKGGNGFKDATTDPERIARWWERHPDHNIGLATGHAFDVIDVDTKDAVGRPDPKGVLSFIDALRDIHSDVNAIAVTASGGLHLYVPATGKGNYAGLRPGIDYRGLGGYVVAPPSTLGAPGRGYTWLTSPSPNLKGHNA